MFADDRAHCRSESMFTLLFADYCEIVLYWRFLREDANAYMNRANVTLGCFQQLAQLEVCYAIVRAFVPRVRAAVVRS